MRTYCVTCTGGRPAAQAICNDYMSRQTDQDFLWLVIDDCDSTRASNMPRANVVLQPERWVEAVTLKRNLLLACEWLEANVEKDSLILLIEDDDWYHPAYVSLMKARARELPDGKALFGEAHTRYYNVMYRTGWQNKNHKHASLCSVGFLSGFLPHFHRIVGEVEPDKPFVDLHLFERFRDRAVLFESNLVIGIKGMPGRKGIGGGHLPGAESHQRDHDLKMLASWTNPEDADRYAVYFYRGVETRPTATGTVAVAQQKETIQIVQNHRKAEKVCAIYRQPTLLPDLSGFAAGTFAHGYFNDFRDLTDARIGRFGEYDLVVIGGALIRHGGLNRVIFDHYRNLDIPVVIVDVDRLRPQAIRTWVNGEPWLPPYEGLSRIRMRALNLDYTPKPRGDVILVAGQRPDLDAQLIPALEKIRANSIGQRQIVFRPHPNMWAPHLRGEYGRIPELVDEISAPDDRLSAKSRASLEEDFARAYVVMTHSSIVGVQALMRGIPVVASDYIVCRSLVCPLEQAHRYDELERPAWKHMERFLRRLSYTLWYDEEFRSGECLEFLSQFFGGGP